MHLNEFMEKMAEGLRDIEKGLDSGGYYEGTLERDLRYAKKEVVSDIAYLVERLHQEALENWI